MLQGRGIKSQERNSNGKIKISNRISMQNNKIMKKLATKLTPAIKEWIKEEFGSDFYYDYECYNYFHFPNNKDHNGFLKSEHLYPIVKENYTLVSEQEFLNEFSKPVQYQMLTFGRWIDTNCKFRIKPNVDYSQEIEALTKKANLNGMKVQIILSKI